MRPLIPLALIPLAAGLMLSSCGTPAPVAQNDTADTIFVPNESIGAPPPATTDLSGDALTANGWGPLRIGMTRAEVVAALGRDANPTAAGGPDPAACEEFRPERAPADMLVMIEQGKLTRISLVRASVVKTATGLAIGDGADKVKAAYGDKLVAEPHKYVEAPRNI